jgi:hypothetical protein
MEGIANRCHDHSELYRYRQGYVFDISWNILENLRKRNVRRLVQYYRLQEVYGGVLQ